MSKYGYPPSHRNVDEPQPEVCDVSGAIVPGSDLITSDVEGLRGARVSSSTPFLAAARLRMSYRDRVRLTDRRANTIGQSRVFEAGAGVWWATDEDDWP